MSKKPITIEDSRLVTVGTLKIILKEERVITSHEFDKINESIDRNMMAIAKTFNQVNEAIADLQRAVTFLVQEIAAMREENKEFRQRTAQLERIDLINERKIDELDGRVLRLETAA